MDATLQKLRRDYRSNSSPDLLIQITGHALRTRQGVFAAWQGGQGAPPNSCFVEIQHQIPGDKKNPTIKVSYQVVSVDSLQDLMALMPLRPSGLLSLPQQSITIFSPQFPDIPEEYTGRRGMIHCQSLYDCNTIQQSGYGQYAYFQVPEGGTPHGEITPKSRVDTNLDQGGMLPYPKNFMITGVSVVPQASASYEDTTKFLDTAWFRLFIGTRDYIECPLNHVAIATAANQPVLGGHRMTTPMQPIHPLPVPLELIPLQTFRAEINFPEPQHFENAFKVWVILHGFFRREYSYA